MVIVVIMVILDEEKFRGRVNKIPRIAIANKPKQQNKANYK